jgi:hypothetical protein
VVVESRQGIACSILELWVVQRKAKPSKVQNQERTSTSRTEKANRGNRSRQSRSLILNCNWWLMLTFKVQFREGKSRRHLRREGFVSQLTRNKENQEIKNTTTVQFIDLPCETGTFHGVSQTQCLRTSELADLWWPLRLLFWKEKSCVYAESTVDRIAASARETEAQDSGQKACFKWHGIGPRRHSRARWCVEDCRSLGKGGPKCRQAAVMAGGRATERGARTNLQSNGGQTDNGEAKKPRGRIAVGESWIERRGGGAGWFYFCW